MEAFSAGALGRFATQLLLSVGATPAIAAEVVDGLVEADLEGVASHGLALLPLYLDRIAAGSVSPVSDGIVVSHRQGAIVLDAEHGLGQATSAHAVRLAVSAARSSAIGAVAVRNGFHFGTAARWARAMARQGCIGLASSNTRPLMPGPGGAERVVGNNPLAIAVPGQEEQPFAIDLALSAAAMGKIRLAEAEGRHIPAGWAADGEGQPTTDPVAAIAGMLLPAAGPKGFGLAMMVDILCGGLSSGAIGDQVKPLYGDAATPYGCAHFFLAIDIAAFRAPQEFAAETQRFVGRIRGSRPATGTERVRIPGDRSRERKAASDGLCRLSGPTASALRAAADRHDIAFPKSQP